MLQEMSRRRALRTAVLAAALAFPLAAGAQDDRLKQAFDAEDIRYSVTKAGNYTVSFDVGNDRTHDVNLVSKTEKYMSLELREIWAVAYDMEPGEPDAATVADLLERNSSTKVGAWAIEKDGDAYFVLYTVKIPATVPSGELVDLVYYVAEICDELEAERTGEDQY